MAHDTHYPTVDFEFIKTHILNSDKIIPDSEFKVGDTTAFILHGKRPIYHRTILIRELEAGQVTYMQATGLAIRLDFMGALLKWFEENKSWKDGAYFVAAPNAHNNG